MKKIALHGSFSPNMVDCLQKKCPEGFEVYQISKDTEAADLAAAATAGGAPMAVPAPTVSVAAAVAAAGMVVKRAAARAALAP